MEKYNEDYCIVIEKSDGERFSRSGIDKDLLDILLDLLFTLNIEYAVYKRIE